MIPDIAIIGIGAALGAAVCIRLARQLRAERAAREHTEAELRAAMASAEDGNRAKSEFLAMMSHEIRTPMSGVVGMAELLAETELGDDQREYVDTIKTSAWALLGIINDVLDLAKIEARRLTLEVADFDLRATLDDVMSLLAERAHGKGLELSRLVHPDVPTRVSGDGGRVRQVLTNLIGNAVKFTNQGTITVRVTTEASDDLASVVRVEVRDSGVGIAPEELSRLFQPFAQAGGPSQLHAQGTGLGLAISKELVELMGGEIGAQSEPGRGSTFWFTARLARPSSVDVATPTALPPARVLVVDPRTRSRNVLELQLGSFGLRVDGASDEASAIDRIRAAKAAGSPYALVLCDVDLPGLTGASFVRLVRADESLAGPAFVLLGPARRRADMEQAAELGIARHLTKPVREGQLRECLLAILTSKKPASAPATRRTPRATTLRALLAEDNAVNQRVAVRALTRLGYVVDVVGDGRQAVTAATTERYDIVLMDWQMPELDGLSATTEIRHIEANGRRTPIVAMTANALAGMRERCLAAGMDDYVSKPVSLDTLQDVLARWNPTAGGTATTAVRPEPQALVQLRAVCGDDELAEGVIRELLAEWPAMLERLREAAAETDVERIRTLASDVARGAALVGATRMATLAGELVARADASTQVEGILIRLEREMQRAEAGLDAGSRRLRDVA